MIARLSGKLVSKTLDNIIIDVGGIGYEVYVPLSTFYTLPEEDNSICLLIYTHVKEDALKLFGFLTTREKQLFIKLITVSGIGPKLGLNILSGIESGELITAVMNDDATRLCAIPGVGKKMAGRMILELKDKLKVVEQTGDADKGIIEKKDLLYDDVLSALINLGYKKNNVENKLSTLEIESEKKDWTFEELLKTGLKLLSK